MQFQRILEQKIFKLKKEKANFLLLGPRQTGKSTLIENILRKDKKKILRFKFQETKTFEDISKRPSIIFEAARAALEEGSLTLFIDEIQLIPSVLNDCQSLIDEYKNKIQIFITGSSARKLRRMEANLLPGRVIYQKLFPLTLQEIFPNHSNKILKTLSKLKVEKSSITLEDLLIFGSLPGILNSSKNLRGELLTSYVSTYLQEEIRAEAVTRNLGAFARFLELAAYESGSCPNLSKLSQEVGIPLNTIKNYYQILDDTLITFSLPAFLKEGRKRIVSTPRYFFFDLGVRNACAGLELNPHILKTESGKLFEHFVILELVRRIEYYYPRQYKYYYWRTNYGAKVDLVLESQNELIPIEIKYTQVPRNDDISHLKTFMSTYGAKKGYLVGRFDHALKMTPEITALPWQEI